MTVLMAVAMVPMACEKPGSISSERRIVNVHEHLQSLAEVPKMIAAMDSVGIRKTILVGSPLFTFTPP